jgi:sulfofructose kinase
LSARDYDLVGFGIAAVDDIVQLAQFPERDTKVPITRIERHGGGQCATALIAAARQGLRCAYAGILGDDDLSVFTRNTLLREQVEVSQKRSDPEARPYYSIVLVDNSTGERTLLFSGCGVRGPAPEDISEDLISRSRMLFVDQLGPAGTLCACRLARTWGAQVIADFERSGDADIAEAMLLTDHLIVPMRLARDVTGCSDAAAAAAELARSRRTCTAVTDGSRGCWFVAEDGRVVHQPSLPVDVVDTTGCGDVFHGAYAAAILLGMSPANAIRYAAAAAALKARHSGAQKGIPNRSMVEGFLAKEGQEVDPG